MRVNHRLAQLRPLSLRANTCRLLMSLTDGNTAGRCLAEALSSPKIVSWFST